jgi:3',5'-cyclic AMP phosphodiesterase CpdA
MKLIHITDPHLVRPGEQLYGLDPCKRLTACIADINLNHGDADLCVITGDLTHWGDVDAYYGLRDCLERLEIPLRLVVGNHDKRAEFLSVFPRTPVDENGFVQSVLDTDGGRCLFLDTIEPGTHAGHYCAQRQDWLRRQLDDARDCAAVYLFMHHPPFILRIPSMDSLAMQDRHALAELLAPYRNIRHLFFGHVHRPVSGSWRGIPFTTLRGTSHQVWLDFQSDQIRGSHEPPAYAIALIEPDQVVVHFHDFLDIGEKFEL